MRGAVLALALLAAAPARADVRAQTSADSLEVRGAGGVRAELQELAETYMVLHPKATIIIGRASAGRGMKALIIGVAEIAMSVDEVPDDIERLASERGVKLMRTCVFLDGVVPVVAPENPVGNLTLKQLRDIFRGELTNWKEVGGADAKIEVVSHDRGNGSYEIFKAKVLGDEAVVTPEATIAGGGELAAAITKDAIGYAGMSNVGKLKALTVNGVAASDKTVAAGTYPIIRQSCLYQRAPGSALGNDFVAFVESPVGQSVLKKRHTVAPKGRK